MKANQRSQGKGKPPVSSNLPLGRKRGNEERFTDPILFNIILLGLAGFPQKVVFSKETDLRIRRNHLKKVSPLVLEAIEEAERCGEDVSTENPKIRKAFILDEIALYGRPVESVPPDLFNEACKVRRRKLSPDHLDVHLYIGIMQKGWHRLTYRETADELWKIEDFRKAWKTKPKEGLIRSRLNILGVPAKR
jgi:hypothetical protein